MKKVLIFLLILGSLFALILFMKREWQLNRIAKVNFPLNVLDQSAQLINVQNIESIWEYYLLENLSCGLVRDSQTSTTGYEGCVASKFYKENPFTWIFILKNLRWSTGEEFTASEIRFWISDLISGPQKRHIKILRNAKHFSFDENTRILKIEFSEEIDVSLLHELSLAEAGVLPINFRSNGWSKTIGPYFVDSRSPDMSKIILKANQFSPLYNDQIIHEIELFSIATSEKDKLFKSISVDVVPLSASTNLKVAGIMLENAPKVWVSHPVSITAFYFNANNVESKDVVNRQFFASVVKEIRSELSKDIMNPLSTLPEEQMIPVGYSGRLDDYSSDSKISQTKLRKLKIRIYSVFKDLPKLLNLIQQKFHAHGVEVEFIINSGLNSTLEVDEFAGITVFLGNQKDATGSWAFHTMPPNGILSSWKSEIEKISNDAFATTNFELRQKKMKELHKLVLNKFLIVPLMIGSQRFLMGKQIDSSSWNRFDSRFRLYELRWDL